MIVESNKVFVAQLTLATTKRCCGYDDQGLLVWKGGPDNDDDEGRRRG